jgi:hypothetical protein
MKTKLFAAATFLLLAATQIRAADDAANGQNAGGLFRADEYSLDLAGTVAVGPRTFTDAAGNTFRNNAALGLGAGVNYFATRCFGVGLDGYTESTHHNFVDNVSGNLIARLPFEPLHLAPYVFGGIGYRFDPVYTFFGQFGAGLEFRVCHYAGIFVEARYVVADRLPDYGLGRAGLRFAF